MMRATAIRRAVLLLLAGPSVGRLGAQAVTLPLTPDEWTATDSIRFEPHLGRPSIYINKGVAMSRTARFRNGTIEFDMAAGARTSNFGIAFRARDAENFEVVFFRPGATGTDQAMQYGPALNGVGAAWQIFHGPGANATIEIVRDTWIHVKVEVIADSALVFVGGAAKPTLVIPRLVLGGDGTGFALWAALGGRGGYYSNISLTPDPTAYAVSEPPLPAGTIVSWELSPLFDAASLEPGTLPNLRTVRWDTVHAEWPGLVLVNRYRRAPGTTAPSDVDSTLHGRVPGSKVVFARTVIQSDRARVQLLHFGYSDNIVVYCNGQPLFQGVIPYSFRGMGHFNPLGDAVFLPLRKGRNEIVYAVTEFFGGWAFSGRLSDTR